MTMQVLFLWMHGDCTSNSLANYMGTKTNCTDWTKLHQMMQFLKQTEKDKLTLRPDGSGHLSWHCDAAFVLHNDFRSHKGSTFLMGDGAITPSAGSKV